MCQIGSKEIKKNKTKALSIEKNLFNSTML